MNKNRHCLSQKRYHENPGNANDVTCRTVNFLVTFKNVGKFFEFSDKNVRKFPGKMLENELAQLSKLYFWKN